MAPGSRLQELTAKYMQNPRRFFVPLANEYRLSGDLDRAIALCREHLPSQPGHMSGHIVLGRAYYEKGDMQAAREVFVTSVALDDENLIALRHLGDIARRSLEVAEARGWYARVLDADPENREIEELLRSLDAPSGDVATPPPLPVGADATADPSELQPPIDTSATELLHDSTANSGSLDAMTSALADPTPPGLRAIVGDQAAPAFADELVRRPEPMYPAASRPLVTFDLSTLGESIDAEIGGDATGFGETEALAPTGVSPTEAVGVVVGDGGGFVVSDLDELVDTVGAPVPDTLPTVAPVDQSPGLGMPAGTGSVAPDAEADELLARPVFGAMASFASWRTAQERATPAASTVQPAPPQPLAPELASSGDDNELFWSADQSEASGTAPEFVTETMAALYAQQGFTLQALDVYRALLERNPGDPALSMKVLELQAVLDRVDVIALDGALQDDADDALQFGGLDDSDPTATAAESVLEERSGGSPPSGAGDALDVAFGIAWSPAADSALTAGDDWFADTAPLEPTGDEAFVGDEMFGVAMAGFAPIAGLESSAVLGPSASNRPAIALLDVVQSAPVAAADDAAAELLVALVAQMVGRLPKEPPTLPVPDILELPSAVPADSGTGASAAPLLSFDRFFSGSGSPPRARIDTPVRPTATPLRDVPSVAPSGSPSLSPTVGGVPMIPLQGPSAPPPWSAVDQIATPARGMSAVPASAPPSGAGAFWTPAVVGAIPRTPVAAPATPLSQPLGVPVTPSAAVPPTAEAPQPESPRAPPSDFHRWLEGLS